MNTIRSIDRAAGIELEMELAYAGLQQLCAPFLDRLERLPARSAMRLASHSVCVTATCGVPERVTRR